MSKCYVSLTGGLGNQLFQAATGFSYAKQHNKELVLDLGGWTVSHGSPGKHPSKYSETLFKNFEYVDVTPTNVTALSEEKFNYTKLPVVKGDVELYGYFQSVKYFEEHADEFKSLLNFEKYKDFDLGKLGDLTVAAHVRRGDYLMHRGIHYVCDANYFRKAFTHFPNNKVSVFSDSIDYTIEEFEEDDVHFIVTDDEVQTLYILSQYDNLIASNSSFSWWASFLGKKKNKIIVPDRWFNNFQAHDDIYRSDFTRLAT